MLHAGWHDRVQCGLLAYLDVVVVVVVVVPIILFRQNCYISLAGWHDQVHRGLLAYLVDVVVVVIVISFNGNSYISFAGWHDQVHRGLLAHRPEQERQEKSLRGDQQQALRTHHDWNRGPSF